MKFLCFIIKYLKDSSPLCGATDTPVLDLSWCLLWVSKPEWAALFVLGRGIHITCSLALISGITPADLLAVSMAIKPTGQHGNQAILFHRLASRHWLSLKLESTMPLLPYSVRLGRCSTDCIKFKRCTPNVVIFKPLKVKFGEEFINDTASHESFDRIINVKMFHQVLYIV